MQISKNQLAHSRGPRAKLGLASLCLSAVFSLASACGDDGSSDESPDETPSPVSDAGTGRTDAKAPTAATPDTGVEEDPGRTVDAGRDEDEPADAGTAPPADASTAADAATGTSASALRGKALADKNVCTSCHQASYAGAGFYPNITPDMKTGIGTWTDKQISDALVKGVDDEGDELCAVMMRYKFSASELTDMVAFLRSLPPKANMVTGTCPGG
jgi:hypothetical protein